MYRIYPRAYFFLLLCNIAFWWITASLGVSALNDPFSGNATISVDASDLPAIYNGSNPTGTVFDNVANPTNSSEFVSGGNGNPFLFVDDYFQIPFAIGYYIVQFLSGGFIFSAIEIIGFPTEVAQGIQIILAFWAIYTIVYYLTGKG